MREEAPIGSSHFLVYITFIIGSRRSTETQLFFAYLYILQGILVIIFIIVIVLLLLLFFRGILKSIYELILIMFVGDLNG